MSTLIEQVRTATVATVTLIHDHDYDGNVHHWFVVGLEMSNNEDHVQVVELVVSYDPSGTNLQRLLDENGWSWDHSYLRHVHQGQYSSRP